MSRYSTPRTALTLILLALALPAMLLAAEPETDKDSDQNDSTVVIIGDDGEELTLSLEDGELTVVTSENGKTTTRIMDVDAMSQRPPRFSIRESHRRAPDNGARGTPS